MTTRPTDEEIRTQSLRLKQLEQQGESFRVTHSEFRGLHDLLESWLAERQAAKAGVTEEVVKVACNGYNQALRDVGYNDERDDGLSYASPMAMRAALQSVAQPVMVPDALTSPPLYADESREEQYRDAQYVAGWNACREAMLSTSPQPQQAVPEGWKLVPINADNVMRVAGEREWRHENLYRIWEAMLSAAPTYNGKKDEEE